MDPLASLPPELLHGILCLLPDLPSLHALYHASPTIFRFLHWELSRPSEIVESIIARRDFPAYWRDAAIVPSDLPAEPRGMLPGARFLIRAMIYLWWRLDSQAEENPFPNSYEPLVDFLLLREVCVESLKGESRFGLTRLPISVPRRIICKLLSFSTRLRQLSHVCFHDAVRRCLSLRPERPVEQGLHARGHQVHGVPYVRRPKAKVTVITVDVGPPSWIEEQRLMLGLLWLYFLVEVKRGIRSRMLFPLQPTLTEPQIGELGKPLRPVRSDWEPFFTARSLSKKYAATFAGMDGRSTDVSDSAVEKWLYACQLAEEAKYCCATLRPWRSEDATLDDFTMDEDDTGFEVVNFFKCRPPFSYDIADNDIFRILGLTIWDSTRLNGLGLGMKVSGFPRSIPHERLNGRVWMSILTDELRAELYPLGSKHV